MNSLIIPTLLFLIKLIKSDPYNPLNALDWTSINLLDQISDTFKDQTNSYEGTGFVAMDFEVRTYDGIGNNLVNTEYGSTNSQTPRCVANDYADGIDALSGGSRMNPREISNVIAKQVPENDPKFVNERHLTQFAWQWGQFIDHDVTLISEERNALDLNFDIDIYIPCSDPEFDPDNTCDADLFMEVFRTLPFPGTGDSVENPREQRNEITAFVDASMIYGSDAERALTLRSYEAGKLLVTEDNFMPYNTVHLVNEPNEDDHFFVGGDVRPNEQLGLLTMHTIWVRFHNVLAEEVAESVIASGIATAESELFDEIVYQYTKLIVTAIVQKITYKDWLPTLFGQTAISEFLPDYEEYDESINPGACPIFSDAAYRLGHTLLPNFLPLRNADCSFWEFDANLCDVCDSGLGGIELRNAFFVPEIAQDNDGFFEALLNGMTCTLANEIDVSITEGVRNFLFESAVDPITEERLFGNLDLIAINLQRGREHGLPDYNTVRQGVGLSKLNDFSEMTSDPELQENFEIIYGDINDVDLFLGGLAEDHYDDGSFGETISAIVLGQFQRLRDGDRFWYQRYIQPGELLDFINCMTLKSVIELTTDIENIDSIDSIRHNIFQNHRAISIFAGSNTFEAQSVAQNVMDEETIYHQPKNNQPKNNQPEVNNPIHKQPPVQQPPKSNYYNGDNRGYHDEQEPVDSNPDDGAYVVQITNLQMVLMLAAIMVTVACTCYAMHQCKKHQMNKYRPVKYVDTETDLESDREKLHS